MAADVLVIGYGNPARGDDGLGVAFADAVARLSIDGVEVDSDYQLTVEDAAAVAEHKYVVFVDADACGPEPFSFRRIEGRAEVSFTSHSVDPQSVLGLAHKLFGAATEGYLLGIRGYEFENFTETLSEKARANLDSALRCLEPVIRSRSFERAAGEECQGCCRTCQD